MSDQQKVCPSCGHCPTCGRRPQANYPYYPPQIRDPWTWPYTNVQYTTVDTSTSTSCEHEA